MEIEDLVDFSSYTKGKEILVEKYDVKFFLELYIKFLEWMLLF